MASYQRAYSDHPNEGQNPFSSANNLQGQGGYSQGGYRDEPSSNYGGGYGQYNNGGGDSYPMSSNNPYASAGSQQRGYNEPKKSKKKMWIWIGVIIALLIVIGGVLGGVLGTQLNKKTGSGTSSNNNGGSGSGNTGVPSGIANTGVNTAVNTGANGQSYLAIATDTYMLPVYATGTNTAGYSQPTSLSNPSSSDSWPTDPSPPSNSSIRPHPRLIAPGYKWQALQNGLVNNDPYLKYWHGVILNNASSTLNDAPLPYTPDGGLDGSGVLDVAQHMKLKVKNWAYAYRMTNETKYADRVWLELTTAAGNNSDVPFGADGTRWNPAHFLDVAQFCNVFAIGYDWLYDYWTDAQRDALMWSILNLGLSFGQLALTNNPAASSYSWWTGSPTNAQVNGNWNCVCNGGLSLAAMAIVDRDPTGVAANILSMTVPNAFNNCFQGAHPDGTWAETANYWYFGTCAAAEFSSSLKSAYGDDRGLAMSNPGWNLTSLYHIYVQGMTSLFNYGDVGPNKYATTANGLMYWSSVFGVPRYSLYQRDRYDASEPFAMFWYDPAVSGTWWDGLPIDAHFSNPGDDWATGRSNWADNAGTYWAMKSGALEGHQTHGDLDLGDFVVDAIGQRWFGDLGSGQYLAPGYFSSEAQNSWRWLYYRKATMGQNTILVNGLNQNVGATPSTNFGTSGTAQGPAPSFNVSSTDTAFFTTDLTSAYNNTLQRGIRFLNGRQQILLQDDFNGFPSGDQIQWRAHTNASVSISSNGATATLTLASQTMLVSLVNPPASATFSTQQATPLPGSPSLPQNQNSTYDYDMDNSGTTVLTVAMTSTGGNMSLQVLMNPQWQGLAASSYVTPSSVPVSSWSLTSHN